MSSRLISSINQQLRELLSALGCGRGKFDTTGRGAPSSLSGTRPNGQAAFRWAFPRELNVAVAEYLEQCCPPDTERLRIHIDLGADTFRYELTTRAEAAQLAQTEAQQELERRRRYPRNRTPYGAALAEQVAAALQRRARGFLGYSHRDYGGFGLEYEAGEYRYGSIWEGELEAQQTWADRAAFVAWLAAQSDFSLSQVEQSDPWLWDNQTLTQQRLVEFVRGA